LFFLRTIVIGLKKAWSDGTTAIELSPSELVERLSAIICHQRRECA
jgi:hypothetical protein